MVSVSLYCNLAEPDKHNEVFDAIIPDHMSYVLSVRDCDKANGEPCVKHYRIRKLDEGGYFISAKRKFKTLLDIIDHYAGEKTSCEYYLCVGRCFCVFMREVFFAFL